MTSSASDQTNPRRAEMRLPTLRDIVAPVFRHKWAGVLVTVVFVSATFLGVLLSPPRYEAEMTLLVKRERADTIVSAGPSTPGQGPTEVGEGELNSEVQLLRSRDLLEQVAQTSGLVPSDSRSQTEAGTAAAQVTLARVVRQLESDLEVTPARKTNLIMVSYVSTDPNTAARVLANLGKLYLAKHLALHRAVGAYDFFKEQSERFRGELTAAELKLKEYGQQENIVSADLEKESALRQLAEFEAALQQTHAQLAEANRKMAELDLALATTPARQTTQIRTSDNSQLISDLKAKVLDLDIQRTEMGRKFNPTYPPVLLLDEQLAQARAALANTEQSPLTEQTTDENPTHQWVRSEMARVRTERGASIARASAISQSVKTYQDKARQLEEKGAVQQDLRRVMKNAEENYLLYLRKQEEARISDALDQTRIANVAIAEAPTVPAIPSNSGQFLILILGSVVAVALGIAATYLLDYASPYFQTPDDVEKALDIPVLASLSARSWALRQR